MSSKRIAHVTAVVPPYWNGISHVVYRYAMYQVENGYDVTVYTAQTQNKDDTITQQINIKYLPSLFQIGNAPLIPGLLSQLRDYDLIHLHYPFISGSEFTILASKLFHTPLVLTYHNQLVEQHKLKNGLFRIYNAIFEPLILRNANYLLAVRREHYEKIHPDAQNDQRLIEVPNGVDTKLFHIMDQDETRKKLSLPIDDPIALFVGALDQAHRYKNVEGQIRAFAELNLPYAQFLIVGDGDKRQYFEDIAMSLGLSKRVHFLGKIDPSNLPPLYNAADVLLLPSFPPESFGMPIIEALACGTTAISSDLPGVKEAINDGVDGYVVPKGNIESLTSTLQKVLSNRKYAKEMGKRGRAKVVREYDWQVIGNKLDQIYQSVITDIQIDLE